MTRSEFRLCPIAPLVMTAGAEGDGPQFPRGPSPLPQKGMIKMCKCAERREIIARVAKGEYSPRVGVRKTIETIRQDIRSLTVGRGYRYGRGRGPGVIEKPAISERAP